MQLHPDQLEHLLLDQLEKGWQEVDTLIREQEEVSASSAIIHHIRPKYYIWSGALSYCRRRLSSLYRLCRIRSEY
jgi:hypothetical protein